ncbi:MAG TPA: MBL fold metallo-hydrolase [Methylomusa anaerophila]|uniref:Hydroxyacylglutathione hydrolase n=1 Tax=Methylomusa anaerophila TaxID=1930071 RepID=A0A348ALX5_9FIRM|nr:MBL fold metallo-hydrolase [Methylomusa anaerophila]BBB92073.1 hydroxyacylglutathione hydrolase [Methylomusa anaerophila]HML87915.1 MBL fold metallo-hydrolase [Methylomusa anaerophila]
MDYMTASIAPDIFVIAVDDTETWGMQTYTNLYVLKRKEQLVLIDAGSPVYVNLVKSALKDIGYKPDDFTHVLFTHGHHDHVGCAELFRKAQKRIHRGDLPLLAPHLAAEVMPYTVWPDERVGIDDLEWLDAVAVDYHTPGSTALYDHGSRALFAGDFFCFFGDPLPEGKLISYAGQYREACYKYVADQIAGGSAQMDDFRSGLERLMHYQPAFFCTGHGVILQDDIQDFVRGLWQNAV